MKPGSVLINVGRGPVVETSALLSSLSDGRLRGLALDVFDVEPLPKEHELWQAEGALISPHNMDQTKNFMRDATDLFVMELLPKFIAGTPPHELDNQVDKVNGY